MAFSHLYHTLGLVNTNAFSECHMALLGKRDGHARVPYGTLGSERVNRNPINEKYFHSILSAYRMYFRVKSTHITFILI